MSKYDVLIVGGGIVGLGTALNLLEQRPGLKICVLEKEGRVAGHQTGHKASLAIGRYIADKTLRQL